MSDADYYWGVAYQFDDWGTPTYVEDADHRHDAEAWLAASGDDKARLVRARKPVTSEWEVVVP